MPLRASENYWGFGCHKVKILEKIALRAPFRRPTTIENRDFAHDREKNENPAKMTDSICDLMSRDGVNPSAIFQYISNTYHLSEAIPNINT